MKHGWYTAIHTLQFGLSPFYDMALVPSQSRHCILPLLDRGIAVRVIVKVVSMWSLIHYTFDISTLLRSLSAFLPTSVCIHSANFRRTNIRYGEYQFFANSWFSNIVLPLLGCWVLGLGTSGADFFVITHLPLTYRCLIISFAVIGNACTHGTWHIFVVLWLSLTAWLHSSCRAWGDEGTT